MPGGAKLALPTEAMGSEMASNAILGFGQLYESKKDKNNSLSYKYEFLCFCVDDVKWFARVQGVNYGPFDYKAELLDAICYDLSAPVPDWVPEALEQIAAMPSPESIQENFPEINDAEQYLLPL